MSSILNIMASDQTESSEMSDMIVDQNIIEIEGTLSHAHRQTFSLALVHSLRLKMLQFMIKDVIQH